MWTQISWEIGWCCCWGELLLLPHLPPLSKVVRDAPFLQGTFSSPYLSYKLPDGYGLESIAALPPFGSSQWELRTGLQWHLSAKSSFDHPAFEISCSWLSALVVKKQNLWSLCLSYVLRYALLKERISNLYSVLSVIFVSSGQIASLKERSITDKV